MFPQHMEIRREGQLNFGSERTVPYWIRPMIESRCVTLDLYDLVCTDKGFIYTVETGRGLCVSWILGVYKKK